MKQPLDLGPARRGSGPGDVTAAPVDDHEVRRSRHLVVVPRGGRANDPNARGCEFDQLRLRVVGRVLRDDHEAGVVAWQFEARIGELGPEGLARPAPGRQKGQERVVLAGDRDLDGPAAGDRARDIGDRRT
jgi:hypothetical protein